MSIDHQKLVALIDSINSDKSFCEENSIAKVYVADGPNETLIVARTVHDTAFNAIIVVKDDCTLCKVSGPKPRITKTRGIVVDGARRGKAFKVTFPGDGGEKLIRWALETGGTFYKITGVSCSVSDPI